MHIALSGGIKEKYQYGDSNLPSRSDPMSDEIDQAGAPEALEEVSSITLEPAGAAATTIDYDLSGLDGSSQEAMTFTESMHVAVDQNAPDPEFPDNIVYVTGWNTAANGQREDTGKAAFSWRMERSYRLNGDDQLPMGFESHWQLISESGTVIRPMGAFAAHDGSRLDLLAQVNNFSVEHPTSPGTGQFKIDFGIDRVSMVGLSHLYANNTPGGYQLNAAGNVQVALPYLDNLDGLTVPTPIHQTASPKANPYGAHSYVYRNLLSPAANYYGEWMILDAAGVTGTFIERYFAGSATINLTSQRTNNHATGGLQDEFYTTAGNIGHYHAIGGTPFITGMRASDGAYCVSPSGTLDDAGLVVRQNGRCAVPSVPPASASAAGETGDITWDASFIYVCVATNTWKRVAIATW
jgi:hypothetical protein